jgi:hypothetical protein
MSNLGPKKRDAFANAPSTVSRGERLRSSLETGFEEVGGLVPGSRLVGSDHDCFRLTSHSEVKTSPRLARSTEPEVGICEGKLTDSGWLKGPQKGSCDRFCIIADRRF